MEKTNRKQHHSADRKDRPAFLEPSYIDDMIVRIVRSHITNELYINTEQITQFAGERMQYYLCTRGNVPDGFWEQSLETVLRRSTSGVSRTMSEAVSDAFSVIQEESIRQIVKPEQRGACRQQVEGRMNKSCDSVKLIVREKITAVCGSMSLREYAADTPESIRKAAAEGLPIDFTCEIQLKAGEKKSLHKWYADLKKRREEYEKSLLKAKLDKKKKMERELALQEKVLTAIPKRYRDLYPRARAMRRHFILHVGPTNSGKTYDAMRRLARASSGVYLGPLRLLAYEQFENLNARGVPCSLITGEEQEIVNGAMITASTVEMANLQAYYEVAVIDEAQMITDTSRGGAWTNAILGICAEEVHVCCSPDAEELMLSIIRECKDEVNVIHHERKTPLMQDKAHFTFPVSVLKGDALIVFSRRSVHAVAATIRERGLRCSVIYGALPYDVRHEQARMFASGENDVVVATDAIGMGMNLPIKRVVFLETEKYDGYELRSLRTTEIKQIAGRAGRYGIYDTGYYTALRDKGSIAKAVKAEYPPIGSPIIDFPESLLSVDLSLKETILRWRRAGVHDGWSMGDTDRMLDLLTFIPGNNKQLQYDLITMAFDEEDQILLSLWKQMVRAEAADQRFDVEKALPGVHSGGYDAGSLDKLERKFRICDLLYAYLRKFYPVESLMSEVSAVKSGIAHEIIRILEKQRFQGKRCRICGRKLPWNYEYSICEICYETGRN
ncbi:MAG: helicase [Lachnospiraceae bacterium]|nr:helicase [Lachnospiraceae bacterium]